MVDHRLTSVRARQRTFMPSGCHDSFRRLKFAQQCAASPFNRPGRSGPEDHTGFGDFPYEGRGKAGPLPGTIRKPSAEPDFREVSSSAQVRIIRCSYPCRVSPVCQLAERLTTFCRPIHSAATTMAFASRSACTARSDCSMLPCAVCINTCVIKGAARVWWVRRRVRRCAGWCQ
jgi:hypothetical protein